MDEMDKTFGSSPAHHSKATHGLQHLGIGLTQLLYVRRQQSYLFCLWIRARQMENRSASDGVMGHMGQFDT